MKNTLLLIMSLLIAKGIVYAQDYSSTEEGVSFMQKLIDERIDAFMSALKIAPGSDAALPVNKRGRLSMEQLKSIDALKVKHTKEIKMGTNGVASVLEFYDEMNAQRGSAFIIFETSEKRAQRELLKRLVMNSLPLEVVVLRYEVKDNGPGDFCLVEKTFNKEKNEYLVNKSVIHVIRENVAMSIHVEDSSVQAAEVARKLDEILVDMQRKPANTD